MNKRTFQLAWRYPLVWPGPVRNGDPVDADCLLGQAFGRNSIPDDDLYRVRWVFEELDHRTLDTFAWLRKIHFDPGEPNRRLALKAMSLIEGLGIHGILQWEICAAFRKDWLEEWIDRIHPVWPPQEPKLARKFTTRDVKILSVRTMHEYGWHNPIELAHKRQAVRAALVVRKILGKTPILLGDEPDVFDPASVQEWTSSAKNWARYESLARAHHILFRYV